MRQDEFSQIVKELNDFRVYLVNNSPLTVNEFVWRFDARCPTAYNHLRQEWFNSSASKAPKSIEYILSWFLKLPDHIREIIVGKLPDRLFRGMTIDPKKSSLMRNLEAYIANDAFTHIAKHPTLGYFYRAKIKYPPKNSFESWTTREETALHFSSGLYIKNDTDEFIRQIKFYLKSQNPPLPPKEQFNITVGVTHKFMTTLYLEKIHYYPNRIALGKEATKRITRGLGLSESEVVYYHPNLAPTEMYLWVPVLTYYSIAWGLKYSKMPDGALRMYSEMWRHMNLPPLDANIATKLADR